MSFTNDFKTGVHPYRERIYAVAQYLKVYFKNPVHALRDIPDWDWLTLLVLYSGAAALSGALSGVIALSSTQFIGGLILFPISSTITAFIASGFIYYTFMFVFHREIPLKKIFTIVILSLIPFLALYSLSGIVPPINLVGFLITSLLLIVGLSENTHVERKKIFRLIGGIYIFYLAFWVFNAINFRREKNMYKYQASPESIETLKGELGE